MIKFTAQLAPWLGTVVDSLYSYSNCLWCWPSPVTTNKKPSCH